MDDRESKASKQARKRRERDINKLKQRILKISRERKSLQNLSLKHRTVQGIKLAPRPRTEAEEQRLEALRNEKLEVEERLRRLEAEQ